jgi:hypothetical protein
MVSIVSSEKLSELAAERHERNMTMLRKWAYNYFFYFAVIFGIVKYTWQAYNGRPIFETSLVLLGYFFGLYISRVLGLKLYKRFQPMLDISDPLLDIAKDSLDRMEKKYEEISLRNKHGISRSLQELLEHNEDNMLEFKASMWTKYKTVNKSSTQEIVDIGGKADFLQDEVLHTVAAFLNTEGGTVLIGVKDKPTSWGAKPAEVFGVEADYKYLGRNNRDGDGYILALYQMLNNGFGDTSTTAKYVDVKIVKFNDKEICRIDVKPLPKIMNGELYIKEKTAPKGEEGFYYRVGPSSQKASIQSAARYIRDNFPGFSGSND